MTPLDGRIARGLVLLGIVLLALAAFAIPRCTSERTQGRVDRGQAQAGSDTGAAAVNTLEGMVANDAATDAIFDEAVGAVRAAPEANKGAVAVSQACRFKANRNKPQCQGVAK